MSRIRLLPVLVFGLVSLLGIKLLGLAFDAPEKQVSQYVAAPGERFARAIERAREGNHDEEIITGSTGGKPADDKKAGDKKAEDKKPGDKKADGKDSKAPAEPPAAKIKSEPEGVRLPAPPASLAEGRSSASAAEREVLEKLKERRSALEARDKELEMRDTLLRATERKLDEKIGQLRTLEGQNDTKDAAKNDPKTRYRTLVVMYESMKPKEAARVFDKLDVAILLDLVAHMNPRKMSDILAVMEPGAAGKLTVALARQAAQGPPPPAEQASLGDTELPRLPTPRR